MTPFQEPEPKAVAADFKQPSEQVEQNFNFLPSCGLRLGANTNTCEKKTNPNISEEKCRTNNGFF